MSSIAKISLFLAFMLVGTGFSQTQNVHDILILKDKTVYNVHITSTKGNSVIYSNPENGVVYELNKSEILTIVLENGEVLTFSNTDRTEPTTGQNRGDSKQNRGDSVINYEFGGSVSFMYDAKNGEYNGLLTMTPLYLKYLSSFYLGPVFGLQINWYRYRNYYYDYYNYYEEFYSGHSGEYVVGMQFGGLIAGQRFDFLPYLSLGVCAVSYYNGQSIGVSIPFQLGFKQRISSSTFLNYSFVYNYTNVNDNSLSTFGLQVGISFYK